MSRFGYRAAEIGGRILTGTAVANEAAEVDLLLLNRGLHPISVTPLAPSLWRWRPNAGELAITFRSLATLVAAGVPLERAVAATERLPRQARLREALSLTRTLLREGKTFAAALTQSDTSISQAVLGTLRAGETGGRLTAALEQCAVQLEREAELGGRLRQALAYPAILLVAGTLSVGVITIVVVPRFATILADLGQELPPTTRLLLAIAQLLQSYGWILLTMLVIGASAALHWTRTPSGRLRLHRALLAAPVIGRVRHNFATARLCRALGALLTTGVPVLTALHAASEAAGDAELNQRLTRAAARVEEGDALSSCLGREAVLTPLAQQMMEVGDSSGRLGEMALRAGEMAASDAESSLRTLVSVLEPALVVGFGSLVAFTAAALLQAVYSLRPG